MKGYVYALASKQEDNIYYIGSSINPKLRAAQHKTESRVYVLDPITDTYEPSKADKSEFILSIIDEMDFANRKELYDLEMYWIWQFRSWQFTLKNDITYSKNYRFGPATHITPDLIKSIKKSKLSLKKLASIHKISILKVSQIRNGKLKPKKEV